MAKPPEGWYLDPDGSGTERWFDGNEWTDFRRQTASAGAAATSPPPITSAQAKHAGTSPPASTPTPELESPSMAWESAVANWNETFASLPATPSLKIGMFARAPKGYSPPELKGRELADIAKGWGRPSYWSPEPATGGTICGWSSHPPFALHVDSDQVCDEVKQPKPNELDLSWRLRRLGNVMGKPEAHVEEMVGLPQARSSIGAGLTLLQWHATGYHIALKFGPDGYCLGITSQHASRPI